MHDQQTRQDTKDLRSFGELAFYYILARGGPDTPPSTLGEIAGALHDVLSGFENSAAANIVLAEAYLAARRRAKAIGDDVSQWPVACPSTLDDVRHQLKSIAIEQDINVRHLPKPRRGHSQHTARARLPGDHETPRARPPGDTATEPSRRVASPSSH